MPRAHPRLPTRLCQAAFDACQRNGARLHCLSLKHSRGLRKIWSDSHERTAVSYDQIVLNAMASSVLVVDGELRIRFVNSAAEQMLGVSRSVLVRRRLDDLLPFDSRLFDLVRRVQEAGLRNVAAGANPIALGAGISKAADAVSEALLASATPVTDKIGIAQVATVSSRDEQIGELVGEAMTKVGHDGVVSVEESSTYSYRTRSTTTRVSARRW